MEPPFSRLRRPSALLYLLFVFLFCHTAVQALQGNPESPCASTCQEPTSNTTASDIVCNDSEYNSTDTGARFSDCVTCQLESTHVDPTSGATDVQWGLYNLRYSFSTCIYGFPEEIQSLSTPCQVSCEDLRPAIEHELVNATSLTSYAFCDIGTFEDDTITTCAECYSITETERYLANYIETLRQACHSKVPGGFPFIISPERIFTETLLPASTESTAVTATPDSDSGGPPKNLVLIIVLPILAFLLVLTCLGVGCFMLVRRRRRKAKRTSRSTYLHERWNDTSITTPGFRRSWGEDNATTPGFSPYYSPYQSYQSPTFATPQQNPFSSFDPGTPRDIKVPPESHHTSPVSPPHSPIPLPSHPGGGKTGDGLGIPLTLPPDGIPPWSKKRQQSKDSG
ncbi:hypothetical protein FQN54_005975 [Arachnomyces sp. PD_36]|nr:hypothetical protein FQN54_005975 [Arachnomyces sp. PD_36]